MKTKTNKIITTVSVMLALAIVLFVVGYFVLRSFTRPLPPHGTITEDSVAQTDKGLLQGRKNNGVYNFLGVEYAQATKLFQPAEEIEPWEGVKDALDYGPSSMQQNILGDFGT